MMSSFIGFVRQDVSQTFHPNGKPHPCLIAEITTRCNLPPMNCKHIIKSNKILCERCHDYITDIMEINYIAKHLVTQSDNLTPEWLRDSYACKSSNCTSNHQHKEFQNAVACQSCMPDGMVTIRGDARRAMYTFMLVMKHRLDLIRPPKDIMKLIFKELLNAHDLNLQSRTYCFMHRLNHVQHLKVVHRKVCEVGSHFHEVISAIHSERKFRAVDVRQMVSDIFGKATEFPKRGIFIEQTKYKAISHRGVTREFPERVVDMRRPDPGYWARQVTDRCLHCGKYTERRCSACGKYTFCSSYCQVMCVYMRQSSGCAMKGPHVYILEPRLLWKHSTRRLNWKTFLHEWMVNYLKKVTH